MPRLQSVLEPGARTGIIPVAAVGRNGGLDLAMSGTANDIWVLLDDRAGNRSQALGVAERLARPFREIEIAYGSLAALPNGLLGRSLLGIRSSSRAHFQAPWPQLVIAAGRRTVPVARWIKAQNGGRTKLVQIMDPGSGGSDFDLICRPAHDAGADGKNVLTIAAAPHRWTAARLTEVAKDVDVLVDPLPSPRIALLIGGSTRRRQFTEDMARDLCRFVGTAVKDSGAGVMATTSRRTGTAVDAIARALPTPNVLHRWDSAEANPYQGFLGRADALIVTGESVSMCSEACATGRPVYIFAPPALITPKHARLHAALYDGNHARPFAGAVDMQWSPAKLDVAGDIVTAMAQRGLLT